ncbi:hypothetical protein [Stenotrophomonas sp.]|uniref:hypothetical protein n=1 Tax=Stenotrophomonas sp. TaxID=69392 RepID=UPI0028A9550E|nr:hypothetical protein [Stenotrophomonas sp.]
MNTEHIEKFVNAIACDLEEGGFRQVSGTTLRRSLTEAVSAALPLLADTGIPASQPAELSFDVEAMLTACVPGGNIVDPQVVADNIRAWFADWKPAELAEQQGVEGTGHSTEDNYQHFLSYSGLDGDDLLRYAYYHGADVGLERPALATTGKQQPSTFDGGGEYYADQHGDGAWATYLRNGKGWVYNFGQGNDAEVRAKSVVRELNRQVAAITERMQVAEVQDRYHPAQRMAYIEGRIEPSARELEGMHEEQVGEVQGDSILRAAVAPPRRFDRVAAEAELSALAARQPHGEESCGDADTELQFYREEVLNLPNILIGAGVFSVDHDGDYKAAWANIIAGIERLAARHQVETEENVAADTYWTVAEMIEPYVRREGLNPDGALPASVHDSVAILLEHWVKTRQPVEQVPVGEVYQGSARLPQARLSKPLPIGSLLYAAPPAQGIDLGPGVRAIADERQRQVDAEGYNAENDADYKAGELANAALAYVEVAAMDLAAGGRSHIAMRAPPACWPWHRLWWKPRDARRDLVRAGALIAAQLDVIDSASDAAPGVE